MPRTRLAFILIGLLPAVALAQWGSAFRWGPFKNFSAEDWDLFKKSIQQAIDTPRESGPITWSNEHTTAHGDSQIEGQLARQDRGDCRQVKGHATAKGVTAPFVVTLCRQSADEGWQLVSATPQ